MAKRVINMLTVRPPTKVLAMCWMVLDNAKVPDTQIV
jgi:hypothetical protein